MSIEKLSLMLLMCLVVLAVPAVLAQQNEMQWSRTFGGAGYDGAEAVQQTADGGYIVAGFTCFHGTGGDIWLIKTDASGNEQWSRTFGAEADDHAFSVQQTSDGGYIVAGGTRSYGAGEEDAWLIKTDASGNEQWNRTFGGGSDDWAYAVEQTSDGGYIVAGSTYSYSAAYNDIWLIKTDASGNEQWNRTFGGGSFDFAYDVQQTSDGGYIVAGGTISRGAGCKDAWVIKTDASGNEQWNRTFGGSSDDEAWAIEQTSDGGYIVAGSTGSYGAGSQDVWLIKTDASGTEQWNRTSGGAGFDVGYDVHQTTDGYIVAGRTDSYGAELIDAWVIKTDASGTEQWNRTFGGASSEDAKAIHKTADGYIVAGSTSSYGVGLTDAWLIKLGSTIPVVIITSPTSTTYTTSSVPLSASASGATQMWYQLDGGANSTPVAGGVLNTTLVGLSNGDHHITVYAMSAGSGIGSASVNFTVAIPPATTLYMLPPPQSVGIGQTFTIDVGINSSVPVYAAQYNITFNTSVLEVESQIQGPYLSSDGASSTVLVNTYRNGQGYATYAETRIGTRSGVVGNGTLASITFHVKQNAPRDTYLIAFVPADCRLSDPTASYMERRLVNASVVIGSAPPVAVGVSVFSVNNVHRNAKFDGSGSYDLDGRIVSYYWDFGDGKNRTGASPTHRYATYRWNGTAYEPFTVSLTVRDNSGISNTTTMPVVVYIDGDTNGDGVVDILDAALVGLHWQATYGSSEYSDGADLNNDNIVNILDAAIVGLHWDKRA